MILEEVFPRKGSEGLVVSIKIPSEGTEEWDFFSSASVYRKGDCRFAEVTIQEWERNQLCTLLAERILAHYQPRLLKKLVKKRYFYFTEAEQKEIYLVAKSYQKRTHWKELLSKRLSRFLEHSSLLNPEGFLRFRMEDYYCELEHTVDKAAEDYLIEREYREFIGMLHSLVQIQPSLLECVNLKMTESGEYGLYDKEFRSVLSDELKELSSSLSREDRLLSHLITLSPEMVVIHRKQEIENKELINVILNVFENRVTFCKGCPFCEQKNDGEK